jgi:Reverse transcriptase (RNA-dependent DNA polymerase)
LALEGKEAVGAIMCDLSKAFDTINHSLLIGKLEHMGLRGAALSWVKSYLMNRKQRVSIGTGASAACSSWRAIRHGVPQGSVLGPVLFTLYVNDLPGNVPDGCGVVLFADDTSVISTATSNIGLEAKFLKNLQALTEWFEANKLKLNCAKTQILSFQTKGALSQEPFKYAGELFKPVEHAAFLGLTVDYKLKWAEYVQKICGRLSTSCFVLSKVIKRCNPNVARMVYFAFCQSIIQYGILFWGNATSIMSIFRLQKRAVRTLAHLHHRASCRKTFASLGIITVAGLYILEIAMFVNDNPQHFPRNESLHNHNTRHRSDLHQQHSRLKISNDDPLQAGIKVFNHLPQGIKAKIGRSGFKNDVKSWLLDREFYSLLEFYNYKG